MLPSVGGDGDGLCGVRQRHLKTSVPPSRTLETRYGPMMVPDGRDQLIVRFLDEVGEWAWDEAVFLSRVLSDGARVLDGGAFIGTFGLGLGLNRSLGLLCAVEANQVMLPFLDANLRFNSRANDIISLSTLLIGPDGASRPGFADATNLGSVSYASDASGDPLPPPTSTTTLAALRDRYGVFDLIKLDIEGMEHEVLLGDAAHLSLGRTTLWIECNENVRSLKILDLLLSWRVAVHYFAFPSHNPHNFRDRADPILPWAYEAGLLVSPRTKPALTPDLAAHHCILRTISSRADLEEAMWFTPRWLPSELSRAGVSELAAVASRAIRRQARESFLADAKTPGPQTNSKGPAATQTALAHTQQLATARLAELEEQRKLRAAVEADLARAEELATTRLHMLEREVRSRAAAEMRMAKASSIALGRLQQVGEQRERAAAAESRVLELGRAVHDAMAETSEARDRARLAEIRAAGLERAEQATAAQLAALRSSLAWRLVTPIHNFVWKRPGLYRAWRRGRALTGTFLGRNR